MSHDELKELMADIKEIKLCLLGDMLNQKGLKTKVEEQQTKIDKLIVDFSKHLKKDSSNLMSKIFDWILRFIILALVGVATVQKIKG